VLTWNIEKKGNDKKWINDFLFISRELKPDIILLQEARLNTGLKYVLEVEKMGWTFSPNIIETKRNTYSGVLTASKVNPLAEKPQISNYVEPFARTPKATLIIKYLLSPSQESLLVVNIHGINFVNLEKFKEQLTEINDSISDHDGPIIFSGDFNTRSLERLNYLSGELKEKLDLEPVRFTQENNKEIKRFFFSPPLDHVFYRGLKVKEGSPDVLGDISSSDHKPLFVEFKIKN